MIDMTVVVDKVELVDWDNVNTLTFLMSLPFTVTQKGSKTARIQVIQYGDQKIVIKFKSIWKLLCNLPNAIDKL